MPEAACISRLLRTCLIDRATARTEDATLAQCCEKGSVESKITPRYFNVGEGTMVLSANENFRLFLYLETSRGVPTKRASVLSGFSSMELTRNHSLTELRHVEILSNELGISDRSRDHKLTSHLHIDEIEVQMRKQH
jgi:hypothetical protein